VLRRGRERLSAFVATLGHSRLSFVQFVTDEQIQTVLGCLRLAFDAFDGVPQHVLFDNMKTVVLERDAYGAGRAVDTASTARPDPWSSLPFGQGPPKVCLREPSKDLRLIALPGG